MIIRPTNGVENTALTYFFVNGDDEVLTPSGSDCTFPDLGNGGGNTITAISCPSQNKQGAAYYKYGSQSWKIVSFGLEKSTGFAFNPGTGSFTIDFWMFTLPGTLLSGYTNAYFYKDANNSLDVIDYVNEDIILTSNGISMTIASGIIYTPYSTWRHCALVREAGDTYDTDLYKYYEDGVLQDTANWDSGDFSTAKSIDLTGEFHLYGNRLYIDEFRVTTGRALWNTDFTPPNRGS